MKLMFKAIDRTLAITTVTRKHYLRRSCPVSFAFGAFANGELKGVLTVGKPPSWSTMVGLVGETREMYKHPNSRARDVFELNRLWMDDSLGKNSESRFIGWCLRELRKRRPSMILVSYADTAMGHLGVVYQATNWICTGTSIPFADIHPDGYGDYRSVPMSVRGEKAGNKRAWALNTNIPRRTRSVKIRYVWFANPEDRKLLAWPEQPYPKAPADPTENNPLATESATGNASLTVDAIASVPDPGVESAEPLVIDAVADTFHNTPTDLEDGNSGTESPANPAAEPSPEDRSEFSRWFDSLPPLD
jgi:hypothetical protein